MNVIALLNEIRVEPPFPVEIVVLVDDRRVHVALEWPLVVYLLGGRAANPQSLREALFAKRQEIADRIRAHLYAQGMPLSGAVALTLDDFQTRSPA